MEQTELHNYLLSSQFVGSFEVLNTGWNTLFLISADDSSILPYLTSNKAPVVYSDFDGFILVKY